MNKAFSSRLARLKKFLKKEGLPSALINSTVTLRYLTGFRGSNGILLVTPDKTVFFTDGRYKYYSVTVFKEMPDISVVISDNIFKKAGQYMFLKSIDKTGIEGRYITYDSISAVKANVPGIEFMNVSHVLSRFRSVKDSCEKKLIKKSADIINRVFNRLVAGAPLSGRTELEVAGTIDAMIKTEGGESPSFPTIVASGIKSSFPHGIPDNKVIKVSDAVVIDAGAYYEGYASDCTRTYVDKSNKEQKKVYGIVYEALMKAAARVAPGVKCSNIDACAREYIEKKGYGKYFIHSTGHGVGAEVHESPYLNRNSSDILEDGMVVTVEPGIYLPGKWGIRLENTLLVNRRGAEVLTSCGFWA